MFKVLDGAGFGAERSAAVRSGFSRSSRCPGRSFVRAPAQLVTLSIEVACGSVACQRPSSSFNMATFSQRSTPLLKAVSPYIQHYANRLPTVARSIMSTNSMAKLLSSEPPTQEQAEQARQKMELDHRTDEY